MFEHRLGLVLGKSISEIRALPYPEFKRWQLFELLEPWGWKDREYRTAVVLAKMNNMVITKTSQAKKPDYFMRDMEEGIMKRLSELKTENSVEKMDPEERAKYLKKAMKEFFGA